jgi:GTP1/Obg family GTP-binding protein
VRARCLKDQRGRRLTVDRLPYVHTAPEIQEMKFWRASVRESDRIADPVKRARNQTSRLINLQLGKLSAVTRKASLQFPALRQLQPFERVRGTSWAKRDAWCWCCY